MSESPETLRLIENSKFLRGVSHDAIQSLFAKSKRVTLDAGDRLLSPDRLNEHVYIVISGRLSVQVSLASTEKPIAMLTAGECVGEMSVLVDGMVSAYVIAASACELLDVDYATFWELLDSSSEAARNMLNILVYRVRLGNEVMADSLLYRDELPDSDIIDKLTGLYNYHGVRRKFDRLVHRCMVDHQHLSLILLEVDEHDKEGVESRTQGEQSLRTIARTILASLRPDDHSARLIGKKFSVLLANTTLAEALDAAERLRTAISQTPIQMPDGSALPAVTVSVGVGEALAEDTYGILIARVDMALEKARAAGGNHVST